MGKSPRPWTETVIQCGLYVQDGSMAWLYIRQLHLNSETQVLILRNKFHRVAFIAQPTSQGCCMTTMGERQESHIRSLDDFGTVILAVSLSNLIGLLQVGGKVGEGELYRMV